MWRIFWWKPTRRLLLKLMDNERWKWQEWLGKQLYPESCLITFKNDKEVKE